MRHVTCFSNVLLWCTQGLRLSAWVQANMTGDAGSLGRPHQLWVLQRALQGVQFAGKDAQMDNAEDLLSAMLRPEADKRMIAEQMHELKWLQDAAAVQLSECPVRI